jgi:hypothetical protein
MWPIPGSNVTLRHEPETLLDQQRDPTSGRMPQNEHGSAEAEESTRQTFLVYDGPILPVNRSFASVVAQFEHGEKQVRLIGPVAFWCAP